MWAQPNSDFGNNLVSILLGAPSFQLKQRVQGQKQTTTYFPRVPLKMDEPKN
jgi:hypothetical protein